MPRAARPKARRAVSNAEVARALREMALFLEMDEVPFKPRAYEKAALVVDALDRPLHEVDAEAGLEGLAELPGVGKGIAERIHERLQTGRIPDPLFGDSKTFRGPVTVARGCGNRLHAAMRAPPSAGGIRLARGSRPGSALRGLPHTPAFWRAGLGRLEPAEVVTHLVKPVASW